MRRGLFHRLSHLRPTDRGLSLEDFFTELWAHVLVRHPKMVDALLDQLGATLAPGRKSIETQTVYGKANIPGCSMPCRPDLRITDTHGRHVLIEHKIEADQHDESIDADATGAIRLVSQLERYLSLHDDHQLAFVTYRSSEVAGAVMNDPRYLKPPGRKHFTWADFHPLVSKVASETKDTLVEELLQFMEDLYMRPAREGEGLLPSANEVGEAERRAWERKWDSTVAYLTQQGWQLTYRGLEVFFRRADTEGSAALQLDLRYGETKERDGHLKARLRLDQKPTHPAQLPEDLEFKPMRVRRSSGEVVWDLQLTTKHTRAEWIGTGDPEARLLDFTKLVLPLLHK